MFNPFRKKSFLEKCSDSVLGGLAAVGDVVVATGEVVGDAIDALTTPATKRETVVVHRPVVVEKHTTVVTTNSWAECEARRLRQETMRLREENLRIERELADRRRREAEYEAEKEQLARAIEFVNNAVRVVLNDVITTKRGNTYRVELLLKGDEYRVTVKDCTRGYTLFNEVYYDAVRAYNAFSSRCIILKNK